MKGDFDFLNNFYRQDLVKDDENLEIKWVEFINALNESNFPFKLIRLREICKKILKIETSEKVLIEKGSIKKSENLDLKMEITLNSMYNDKINNFTLLHEIAHYFFDYNDLLNDKKLKSNFLDNELTHTKQEIRANKFAAQILMPEEKVIKSFVEISNKYKEKYKENGFGKREINSFDLDEIYDTLSEQFNVTKSALCNRLLSIGLI